MNKTSGGGVVEQSTPQSNAIKTNNYVHICTFSYLNFFGVDLDGTVR